MVRQFRLAAAPEAVRMLEKLTFAVATSPMTGNQQSPFTHSTLTV